MKAPALLLPLKKISLSYFTALKPKAQKAYVALMMQVVARGLVSASRLDSTVQDEFKGFPVGFIIQMRVLADGPQFTLQVDDHGHLTKLVKPPYKPDLTITFKHITHAFLVMAFQESTVLSFAHDRLVADGQTVYALRFVRALDRMEALILPKPIAALAIKEYPALSLKEKVPTALRIYAHVAQGLFNRSMV